MRSPTPRRTSPGTGRTPTTTPAARTLRASTIPRPTRTRTTTGARLLVDHHAPGVAGVAAQAPRRHQRDGARQKLVLDRAQARADRGRIACVGQLDRALEHDRPGVHARVDEVHRHTEDLHPVLEGLLDRAHAREGRQQRGMDVEDPVGEARHEAGVEDRHVAGEHHELDPLLGQPVAHGGVARGARPELRAQEDPRRHARGPGALERARRGLIAGHGDDLDLAAVDAVEQRLEVRALARGEDADSHGHRHAPPSAATSSAWPSRSLG